jgi:hypothetical protein
MGAIMRRAFLVIVIVCAAASDAHGQPKPAPRMQAVPQPYDQIAFQRDGAEIARYHFGGALKRPFVYPLIGPSGRSLTRMGHPHDPVSHSHHNSVWISHNDVNGVSFWADAGKSLGRIVQQKIEKLTDADNEASVTALNAWIDDTSKKALLTERRKTTVQLLEKGEWLLILDLHFEAKETVTLGRSQFGMVGVRMAKSIGVNDGNGTIRNSEGKVNEKEVFWRAAKWVDYSGAIMGRTVEGITLFDHPSNPNHPSVFHVRNDGWMGASLTFDGPRKIEPGQPLRLRYGLYVHAGQPSVEALERRWSGFAKTEVVDLAPVKKK